MAKTELDFPVSLLDKFSPAPPAHPKKPPINDTVHYGAYLVMQPAVWTAMASTTKVVFCLVISLVPWTMYAGMSKVDLKAIYTYLKTIKPKVSSIKVRSYENR